jgi:membrane-associated PAP2 superfamily phosphatase
MKRCSHRRPTVAVEYGGTYVIRLVRGSAPATDLQLRFASAGHAHAGVLVILTLVALPYAERPSLEASGGSWPATASVYVGAACLAAAVVTLGVGLLTT